ncbi:MAG: DUF2723 domain-containing protein [Flavobacteriales bacterium]|nr:DUF2723 domain-containing protein [Flavobacteriales bacterium]
MDYKKLNVITGWVVFLVAAWTYIITIEETASFWDCGEFLATANKLQVGHPPGAPLFMMLGRIASAFVSPENVPYAVNTLSALCSAFTILFLFWSITHMAHKLATRNGQALSAGGLIAILGSGAVGALAYTWSDSFWFSAVEAEVYSMSSFFTAITFWAILKWESEANEAHSTRWLVLICYLIGLGIGVQLLALLCIPPIALVYYFKKADRSALPAPVGVVLTLVISAVILGAIQAVIIPGVAKVAGLFELWFVNGLELPFNTGNLVYFILVAAVLVGGIYFTQVTRQAVLNTIILGVTVILVGYSTYAMTVIRSLANPPIDENNPENVFNLVSYLNREQYGDRPLLIGQFWDSQYMYDRKGRPMGDDGTPVYTATYKILKNGRKVKEFYDGWSAEHFVAQNPGHEIEHEYVVTDPRKGTEWKYDPATTMLFPRMYSNQPHHISAYKSWSKFKGRPVKENGRTMLNLQEKPVLKPTFSENMRFFFAYQMDWMYWRYFMWNFAGRQNDMQGAGNIMDGNWLTGIKMLDEQRLGNQDQLPPSMTNNKAYNKFFLLPLILGTIGFVFQLLKHGRDWTVVMLLFFFTGIAIVIYLNQTPYQPRERDYAYVGSFYAFAIWIGLGVYAIYDAARSLTAQQLGIVAGSAFALGILKFLVEMISGDNHGVSYILFIMAAIGVGALALFFALGTALRGKEGLTAALAAIFCMSVPGVMVAYGWDDHDRSNRSPAPDLASDYLNSCAPNAILFTNGDNDTFPLWYAQEVEGIRTDVRVVNLSLLNTDWYIDQMRRKAYESDPVPFTIAQEKYRQGTRDAIYLNPRRDPKPPTLDLRRAIAYATDDRTTTVSGNERYATLPTDAFAIPVDRAQVLATGTVAEKDTADIVDAITWRIGRSAVMKNHMMVLDLLAHTDWSRPVYFAVTTGPDSYIGLQDYFQLEGLTYRVVPRRTPSDARTGTLGRVATDLMYENVTTKFKWGNMETEGDIYLDENILRMTTNLRLQLSSLAEELIAEGRIDNARTILDLSLEKMPHRNVPFDRILMPTAEAYYAIGDTAKANALTDSIFTIMEQNLTWFASLEGEFAEQVAKEASITHAVMKRLMEVSYSYEGPRAPGDTSSSFADGLAARFTEMDRLYREGKAKDEGPRRITRERF